MKDPKASVVILTPNEVKNIAHALKQIPDDVYQVVLVDGHSVNNTVAVMLTETQNYDGCAFQKLTSSGD